MLIIPEKSPLQKIEHGLLKRKGIHLYVKRDDLLHPLVSGNKFRKIKYNLEEALRLGKTKILSFGGAYSNHIYSLAAAGNRSGIDTVGIIRGEELSGKFNPTLSFSQSQGMQLHYISREDYRKKDTPEFIESLHQKFGDFYLLPEGGTNKFALKGCAELLDEIDIEFDYISCACGTGGTISGIISAAKETQQVLGFSVLKEEGYMEKQISDLLNETKVLPKSNFKINHDFHFGGYGKITKELVLFMEQFEEQTGIKTDPVYTGKMFFGIFTLIEKGFFGEGQTIIAVHSGGLQGLLGMEEKMKALLKT